MATRFTKILKRGEKIFGVVSDSPQIRVALRNAADLVSRARREVIVNRNTKRAHILYDRAEGELDVAEIFK